MARIFGLFRRTKNPLEISRTPTSRNQVKKHKRNKTGISDEFIASWLDTVFFKRDKTAIWKGLKCRFTETDNWKNAGRGRPFDGTEEAAFKKRG